MFVLLLTVDGVSAKTKTSTVSTRKSHSHNTSQSEKTTEKTTPKSHQASQPQPPQRLQTTWPTLGTTKRLPIHLTPDVSSPRTPGHRPGSSLNPTGRPVTGRWVSYPRQVFRSTTRSRYRTGLQATRTSARTAGPNTSARYIAVTHGPLPFLTSRFWYPTSAPVTLGGGEIVHCQVQLANDYRQMLNFSGSSSLMYGRELGSDIAWLCLVDENRISDVDVLENPDTGLTSLHRQLKSCM